MRGDITKAILGIIAAGACMSGGIVDAFFSYHNRGSYRKTTGNASEIEPCAIEKEKQRVYSVLSKLKKEGCLEAIDQKWKITKFGLAKLNRLIRGSSRALPAGKYEAKKSRTVTVITFDIPENIHYKRDWLRSVLVNLGFTMMHRSVWVGKIAIPGGLIEDIKDLDVEQYIQILSLNNLNRKVS